MCELGCLGFATLSKLNVEQATLPILSAVAPETVVAPCRNLLAGLCGTPSAGTLCRNLLPHAVLLVPKLALVRVLLAGF
jgi:hypothetical protein